MARFTAASRMRRSTRIQWHFGLPSQRPENNGFGYGCSTPWVIAALPQRQREFAGVDIPFVAI
jgi:hypothetical protein